MWPVPNFNENGEIDLTLGDGGNCARYTVFGLQSGTSSELSALTTLLLLLLKICTIISEMTMRNTETSRYIALGSNWCV